MLTLAAPASAMGWNLDYSNGALTITPTSGESVSLQVNAGYYEVLATGVNHNDYLSVPTEFAPLSTIAVVGSEPVDVSILGVDPSGVWNHPLVVTLTHPASTLTFEGEAQISFGTTSVTATAPTIAVRQEIAAASLISLTGTTTTPSIHADVTAGPTGEIRLNGARVTSYGSITLAAGYVQTTGPVVGVTGCFSVEIGCRASAPSRPISVSMPASVIVSASRTTGTTRPLSVPTATETL